MSATVFKALRFRFIPLSLNSTSFLFLVQDQAHFCRPGPTWVEFTALKLTVLYQWYGMTSTETFLSCFHLNVSRVQCMNSLCQKVPTNISLFHLGFFANRAGGSLLRVSYSLLHDKLFIQMLTAQHPSVYLQTLWFDPCVVFEPSPHVCMGFLWVLNYR